MCIIFICCDTLLQDLEVCRTSVEHYDGVEYDDVVEHDDGGEHVDDGPATQAESRGATSPVSSIHPASQLVGRPRVLLLAVLFLFPALKFCLLKISSRIT